MRVHQCRARIQPEAARHCDKEFDLSAIAATRADIAPACAACSRLANRNRQIAHVVLCVAAPLLGLPVLAAAIA